jgi:signal transduction histidine kinase
VRLPGWLSSLPPRLLAPAVRLMHRLRYPYKFALIGLPAFGAIVYLLATLGQQVLASAQTARLELAGLRLSRPLISLLSSVTQHRTLSVAVASGIIPLEPARAARQKSVQTALAEADQAILTQGQGLELQTRWAQVHAGWEPLARQGGKQSAAASLADHTQLIAQLHSLLGDLADNSRLVLDPEADSYNLMDLCLFKLPAVLEHMSQLHARSVQVLAAGRLTAGDRDAFVSDVALLRASGAQLDSALRKVAATSPALAGDMEDFGQRFRLAREQLIAWVNADALSGRLTSNPLQYLQRAAASMDLGQQQIQEYMAPQLEQLLLARADALQHQLTVGAALGLGLLLLFAYLAGGAYLAITATVHSLRQGAQRMAKGDLTTPIQLATHDELHAVADSFNVMGRQLAQRNDQLQQTDATLAQLMGEYEKGKSQALLAAVVPAVAHDLNTTLANGALAADTLGEHVGHFQHKLAAEPLRRTELEKFLKDTQEGMAIISQALRHGAGLVGNLKHLSIDQATQRRRSFELDRLFDEVLGILAPSLRGVSWRLERHVDTPHTLMESYPGPLGQVLINLVQNAAIHAFDGRPGGLLTLQAGSAGDGHLVAIEVHDNGVGMPPEVLAQLFTPFFTTKPGQGGSGVGLAYARRLVQDVLGGRMEVESTPGHGSTFRLLLPRLAPLRHTPVGG